MKRFALVLLAATLVACAGSTTDVNNGATNNGSTNNGEPGCEDFDGDGFEGRGPDCPSGLDCDDSSAQVNPGVAEVCGDRLDSNCDGQPDNGCGTGMDCIDADGDRYGQGTACFGIDCDDANAAIHAGATEICGNLIDEDGDRIVFANEKGGTGKSTTAVHTAIALAASGHRVAALDLDSRQRTMTRYLENRDATMRRLDKALPHATYAVLGDDAPLEDAIAALMAVDEIVSLVA